MTVWGGRILGPKKRIGNGVLKQEGPCSQSMSGGKLVMRWSLRSRQVLGHVPRGTDVTWKAKREMATSEM